MIQRPARSEFSAVRIAITLVLAPLLSVAATLPTGLAAQTVARVEVTPERLVLPVGSSQRFSARGLDAAGAAVDGASIRWISTTPAVLAVDGSGLVTALAPGEGRVAAMFGSTAGFAVIDVPRPPPARLELSESSILLMQGLSYPLDVRAVAPDGEVMDAPMVRFSSSDANVAEVDAQGRITARAPGRAAIRVESETVFAQADLQVIAAAETVFRLEPEGTKVRTGDVVRFQVEARTPMGGQGPQVYPTWSVSGSGAQVIREGSEGVFVADEPGTYRVTAQVGDFVNRSALVEVTPRRAEAELVELGRGPISEHHSGDMWVFEGVDGRDYVYVGTFLHDWMKVWDVTDPANVILTDSLQLDARRINDVKIHPSKPVGIVTREGASNRRNGIVMLDLSTPAQPTIISEYQATVTGGVHNVWIIEDEDLVYAAHNGTNQIHILDISDPAAVVEVGTWGLDKPQKTLHDVIVQDGYAYLSYWNDGVIMLDAGAGTHGGTARAPTFVSQYKYPIGNTHVAWRYKQYLFVGDEIFPPGWDADSPIHARGYIHVLDYSDPENPVEVGRYEVPEAGAHNVWVEDDKLYVGYYQAGLRVVDVSGELRGDLYRQGREIARISTTDAQSTVPNWPMTWGAQIFKGRIYSSDLNSGIWITELKPRGRVVF